MTPLPPIPLDEAQARLLSQTKQVGQEAIPLDLASGRFLAEDLAARRTQPPADLSAMDGYAVGAGDLAGTWRIIGESAAGHPFAGHVQAGEAVRISTGAAMPRGSGAILLQENARRDGDRLELVEDEPTPRHIRRRGFDFQEGDLLLRRGTRLGAAQIALAVAGGHRQVEAGRLPSLAILDSGDELAADPASCAAHQIPASNGAMLAAMAAPFARDITRLGPVPDRMEALLEALDRASAADVLVTSGGASVGDHDLVRPALERWGAGIDFWRVAMKPGKPLLVARRGEQWILGLPGNPVSSYVTAFLFLLPLLRALGGAAAPLPGAVRLALAQPLPTTGTRLELVRARYDGGAVGPVVEQDSSALAALASANALIRREINSPPARTGDLVAAYLLE